MHAAAFDRETGQCQAVMPGIAAMEEMDRQHRSGIATRLEIEQIRQAKAHHILDEGHRGFEIRCGQDRMSQAQIAGDETRNASRRGEMLEVGLEAPDQLMPVARRIDDRSQLLHAALGTQGLIAQFVSHALV